MAGKPLAVRVRQHATVLSFLAPALIGIAVFFVYPLLSAVYFSFTKFDLLSVPRWIGLGNYRQMAQDPFLLQSVRNTLWMVAVFVPVRIVSAIGLSSCSLSCAGVRDSSERCSSCPRWRRRWPPLLRSSTCSSRAPGR